MPIKKKVPLLDKVIEKSFPGVIRRQTAPIVDELKEKMDLLQQEQVENSHLKDKVSEITGVLGSAVEAIDRYKGVAKKRAKMVRAMEVENNGLTEAIRRNASLYSITDSQYAMRMPMFYRYLSYGQMYLTADLSPEVSGIINKLCQELDRRGNRWEPKWTVMCPKCKEKFTTKEPFDRCPICDPPHDEFYDKLLEMLNVDDFTTEKLEQLMRDMGQTEDTITKMLVPDKREYSAADKFFKECNYSGQTLEQVDRQCARDLHITDSWYYIVRWLYKDVDKDGIAQTKVPLEIYRGEPALIRKVIDGYNRVGGIWYKCLVHGHLPNGVTKLRRYEFGNPVENWEWPKCPMCDRPMHEVKYVQLQHEVSTMDKAQFTNYFIDGEVFDGHFYDPNTAHGMPPMITLFIKTATLLHQDNYMYDTFKDRRLPMGLVWSKTANPTSAIARWDKVLERLSTDPTYIPHVCVEPEGSNSGEMGYLPLMPKLNEMEYTTCREENRNIIADFYGVFFASYARSSNNPGASEGPRMQVDPKTVESLENFYNHQHDKLMDVFGINNWNYHKVPAEDRDVMRKLQIEQLEWQNSQIALQSGFETTRNINGILTQRKPPLGEKDIAALKEMVQGIIGLNAQLKTQQSMMDQQAEMMGVQSKDPDKNKDGTDKIKHSPTYSPNTQKTPDGGARLPYDKLQKAEQDELVKSLDIRTDNHITDNGKWLWTVWKPTGDIYDTGVAESEEDGAKMIAHHLVDLIEKLYNIEKALGESRPSTFSTAKQNPNMQVGSAGMKSPPPQGVYTPGGKSPYKASDGTSPDTKEALGGKERSRPNGSAMQPAMGTEDLEKKLLSLKAILMGMLMNIRRRQHPTEQVREENSEV